MRKIMEIEAIHEQIHEIQKFPGGGGGATIYIYIYIGREISAPGPRAQRGVFLMHHWPYCLWY